MVFAKISDEALLIRVTVPEEVLQQQSHVPNSNDTVNMHRTAATVSM